MCTRVGDAKVNVSVSYGQSLICSHTTACHQVKIRPWDVGYCMPEYLGMSLASNGSSSSLAIFGNLTCAETLGLCQCHSIVDTIWLHRHRGKLRLAQYAVHGIGEQQNMTQSRPGAHRHLPSLSVALIVCSGRCSSVGNYCCCFQKAQEMLQSCLIGRFGVPAVPGYAL